MSVGKKLLSNTVYLFLDWFVVTLMGFLYWIIAGKFLAPQEYGIVSTTANLAVVLAGISFLGLNTAVKKLLPEYLSKGQKDKVPLLIRFSLKIVLILNLIFLLTLIIFSNYFSVLLKLPPEVILISALLLFVISLDRQLGSVIYGFQKMKDFFLSNLPGQVIKVIISAFLIFFGLSFFGPLLGFLIGFGLVTLIRFKLVFPYIFLRSPVVINKKQILFEYALPAFTSFLAWILFLNGQYVLLTILTNPEVTGIFTIAMILTSVIVTIPRILEQALFPIISSLSADRNSKIRQVSLLQLVYRYSLFLTLPIAAFLIVFSPTVILIFSSELYLNASRLFPILALGSLFYGIGIIFLGSLYAIGRTKIHRNIVILTVLLFFILAIPLTLALKGFGMALAYTLCTILLMSLSIFFIKKYLKIKLPISSTIKSIVAVLISFTFLYIATRFIIGLLAGIILTFIATLIYFGFLLLMKFFIREDIKLLKFFSAKSPIFKKQIAKLAAILSKYV